MTGGDLLRTPFIQNERGLQNLVSRSLPVFARPGYSPENTRWDEVRVLVVGAGGLGCEVLHALALSGFVDLTVIDMDTIELSNLNRQFLFREADIGRSKAVVAAAFVEQRCPGVHVQAVFGRVEDQSDAFYFPFHAVILCVDSIAARRWVNRRIVELAEWAIADVPDRSGKRITERRIVNATLLIDTGTEGYEGCCRVVMLSEEQRTSCIECMLDLYPPRQTVPLCTLENVPRSPEHCVLYAQFKEWEDHSPGVALNPDDPEHILWIRERAQKRKAAFGILGPEIDDAFTLGVVKNVVPGVGFTNALVAGQAVLELIKILTAVAPPMQCFAYYNGAAECGGLTSHVTPLAPNPSCPICAPRPVVRLTADMTPTDVLAAIEERTGRLDRSQDVDATMRVLFPDGEVYLMYRRSNPLQVPIVGRTIEEIFTEAKCAAVLASWRIEGAVFAIECNTAQAQYKVESLLH